MKILLLNWRDIKNPSSGGAELATHELLKRLAAKGHKIIQISAGFKGAKKTEVVDKVHVIRLGNYFTVHLLAFFYYHKFLKNQAGIIIDQIHGIPFFTPLFAKEPKMAYIHEIAGPVLFYQWPFPVNITGFLIEKLYFKIYRRVIFITVSKSTRNDLINYGIDKKKVFIINNGLSVPSNLHLKHSKTKSPTICYLGRLTWSKRIDDQINAISLLIKRLPNLEFWIIGKGNDNYLNHLKHKVKKLNLESNVKFFGFVGEKEKFNLLSKSWVILSTSVKEGFGLSIIEAAYAKTPAVVYNVGGLSEAVINFKTGMICNQNTPTILQKNLIKVISDKKLRNKLANEAKINSGRFNWDKSADKFEKIIKRLAKANN